MRPNSKANEDKNKLLSVSQNLTTINKELKNKKKRDSKNTREYFLLSTPEQKRLLALCFKRTPKTIELDLSALSQKEQEAYKRFLDYRAQRGNLTLSTQKAILDKLKSFKGLGASEEEILQTINQSIERGYRGLFYRSHAPARELAKSRKAKERNTHKAILKAICEQYPNFDFTNIPEFVRTHKVSNRAVMYENGVFSYA